MNIGCMRPENLELLVWRMTGADWNRPVKFCRSSATGCPKPKFDIDIDID